MRKLISILLLISLILNIHGQDKSSATFTTAIIVEREDERGIPDVTAILSQGSKEVSKINTASDGTIIFKLEPNSEYSISISKPGFVSKIITINTSVPKYENQKFEVAFPVLLFVPCEGLDFSVLQSPVVKLVYDDVRRDFFPEKNYDNTMRAKLEQLYKNNQKCLDEKFNKIVREADRQFAEKKYVESRATYVDAQKLRADDDHVNDRIDEIDDILSKNKDSDKQYKEYLAVADKQFAEKKYALAKEYYKRAQSLKPNEEYPPAKIAEIDKLLAKQAKDEQNKKAQDAAKLAEQNKAQQDQQAQNDKFEELLSQGNDVLDDNPCKAIKSYTDALAIKADDVIAKKRLTEADRRCKEIQAKESQSKESEDKYKAAIAKADALFKAATYTDARKVYLEANVIKPSAAYPLDQIEIIDNMIKKQAKEQDNIFQNFVDAADKAFDKKDYNTAKNNYQKALVIKATDPHCKQQLALIDKLLAEQDQKEKQNKTTRDNYNSAIAEADKLFAAKDMANARNGYLKAQQIIPSEAYPRDKIEEIDALAKAKENERDQQYKDFVSAGDKALDDESYTTAKEQYQKALGLKPNEQYPKDKIKTIDALIADKQKNDADRKAKQDLYDKAIAEADKLFNTGDLTNARTAYQKAQQIMPNQGYPAQKIKEIDNLAKAKDKEKELQYKKLIADADKAFDTENMTVAKDNYSKALGLKPDESYPKEKLKAIDDIIAEQLKTAADKKAKQELYNKALAEADLAFKKPDYDMAKKGYIKASQILPSEDYPKQKISEIETIEKEQADKIERDYAAKIQSGDKNFLTKNYVQAKQDYTDALKIKANEQYPNQRIADIDKLVADAAKKAADEKAKQDAYNAAVTKADNLLKSQQYDQAVTAYREASSIKPDEQYPFTKIEEINQTKKKLELEANYKKAISSADAAFAQKNFEQAKSTYNQALQIKPNDAYATGQIAKADKEIDDQLKRLADAKSRQEAYDQAIKDADKFLLAKDFDMARTSYQKASQIFADKPYPKQKIAEIENTLKEKKRNDDYRELVDEANNLLAAKNYLQSKDKYKAAALVKPEEVFPGEKIKEIDKILAQQEADNQKKLQNEKKYNESISKANDLFDKALYDPAKTEYERSLTLMPDESYPKQRIAKINEIKAMLAKDTKQTAEKPAAKKEKAIVELKFKNDTEREAYLKELLAKYPSGITCEVYKEPTKTITRYIIIRENQANDYREIKHNWGGVDFIRNDKPVTLLYFNTQVKVREGEYFNKTDM